MNIAPTVKIIFVKLLLVKVAEILRLTELWVCVSLAAELHRNLAASCFPWSVPNVLISPRAYLLKNNKHFQAKWRSFDWVQHSFLWEEMVLLKDALRRMFESYTGESSISDFAYLNAINTMTRWFKRKCALTFRLMKGKWVRSKVCITGWLCQGCSWTQSQ